jgi:opacity protein-like surface antigen
MDDGPEPVVVDDGSLGDSQRHVMMYGAIRNVFVLGGGYEPYAERAMLWSFMLGGSGTILTDGPFSFALGGSWEIASSDSHARGTATSISVHRLTVAPEARYNFSRRFLAYGRLGVGGGYLRASLQDPAGGTQRTGDGVLVTTDPGVGVAVQLSSTRKSEQSAPRFWLAADGGYLWSSSADLELEGDDTPQRSAPIRLETLSLHGPYARLIAALTL